MKTFCSYFNQGICKSCDMIEMDYSAQLRRKEELLRKALSNIPYPDFSDTVASEIKHFRNKAKLAVTGTFEAPVIGLFGEENLDVGRELLNCPLHIQKINQALPVLKEFIKIAKLEPYRIENRKGELKGIILFHSEVTHESYLRFILRSKEAISRLIKHREFIVDKIPEIKCISANIQPVPHAVLEGEEEVFITSTDFIHHQAGETLLALGPRAFVQTNQEVATKLYRTAASWVNEGARFMELYCGQGAFSFFAAPVIKEGLGIEINPDAVAVANFSASNAGYHNLRFKASDASEVLTEMKDFDPDVLLVNPPRRGLGETTDLILAAKPGMVIYSSCNYETLAVDLEKLKSVYKVEAVQIFDMFPHTSHFETLVKLTS
jgi:23S rRNA (uracil747-C5)-methyltransferase